jgi:hypothetical protein
LLVSTTVPVGTWFAPPPFPIPPLRPICTEKDKAVLGVLEDGPTYTDGVINGTAVTVTGVEAVTGL